MAFIVYDYELSLVRSRTVRKIKARLAELLEDYEDGCTEADFVLEVLQGWRAYAMIGNSYRLCAQLEASTKSELEAKTKMRYLVDV